MPAVLLRRPTARALSTSGRRIFIVRWVEDCVGEPNRGPCPTQMSHSDPRTPDVVVGRT